VFSRFAFNCNYTRRYTQVPGGAQLSSAAVLARPLAASCGFSSVAALLGTAGQAGHAAANAALDASAAVHSAAGIPAWSVQWGAWATGGGTAGGGVCGVEEARTMKIGLGMLAPADALHALGLAIDAAGDPVCRAALGLSAAAAAVAVCPFDWPRYKAHHAPVAAGSGLLASFPSTTLEHTYDSADDED
jgi:hypothetical protein